MTGFLLIFLGFATAQDDVAEREDAMFGSSDEESEDREDALGRDAKALHVYRSALDVERKNEARIQNNIGNVLARMQRWKDSIAAYHEAEEADPDFPETQQTLAHVFEQMNRHEEAARHLEHAARLLPVNAANFSARSEALRQKAEDQRKAKRAQERRDEIDKRDGFLSREQRVERFQQVVGMCGMDNKECIKRALGQEDAREDDLIVF